MTTSDLQLAISAVAHRLAESGWNDESLWSELVTLARSRLELEARRHLPRGGSHDDVQESVQATLVQVSNAIRRGSRPQPDAMLGYLLTAVRNAAGAVRRSRERIEPLDSGLEIAQPERASELEVEEFWRLVASSLPPSEAALVPYMRTGLSLAEIAGELGISVTALGVRAFRLRQRLQRRALLRDFWDGV